MVGIIVGGIRCLLAASTMNWQHGGCTVAYPPYNFGKQYTGLMRAVAQRLDRVATGNLGDVKSVGLGVSEMRIFAGPGYRLYFTIRGDELIILLCGGSKSTQSRDIAKAQRILSELEA